VLSPLRRSPLPIRLLFVIGSIACCCAEWIKKAYFYYVAFVPDGDSYLRMARGDGAHVMQPFVSRQMGALLAAATARLLHWSVEQAFFLQAIVSVIFLLCIVYAIAVKTMAPRWLLLAIALSPFWGPQVQYFVLPDALYSAELAVLLVLLLMERLGAASLMMFPLMLTRESTSLTLLCFLVAAWGVLRWRDRIAAVLSAAAGSWLVGRLAAGSIANKENLPQAIYLLMKVPWNFLRNVIGLQPWSNVNPELCSVPRWYLPLHLGPVSAIGVCGYSSAGRHEMFAALFYNFGILPLIVCYLWWVHRSWFGRSVLLRFTLLYGSISFLLAPMLGTWMIHLMSYGWPLFFVALPLLFDELPSPPLVGPRAWAGCLLFALQIVACRLAVWSLTAWFIPVEGTIWLLGFVCLRYWMGSAAEIRSASIETTRGASALPLEP
jgi:hypothetical protein